MGEVYRARDTRLDRDVAIKLLPDDMARDKERLLRFDREAKVLASLNHPAIGAIYGLEEAGGRQYLILEFVEGETLADRLNRGVMPVDEALNLAKQIAEALEIAHEKGIVHRDLKPGNVMITADGVVKVLDFGLARTEENPSSTHAAHALPDSPTVTSPARVHSPTIPGVILGTAGYMSPEQARGKPVDKRSDIFSFGCILYEMLTGQQPFVGESVTDSLGAILHREPDWSLLPPTAPPPIRELLHNCLTKDRKNRLRDIGDARLSIENAEGGRGDGTPSTAGTTSRAWVVWIVTAALAAIIVAQAWIMTRTKEAPAAPVVRSSIVIEPGFLGFEGEAPVALSPDGRTLALVGRGASGEQLHIWVRPLDSLTAQLLQGTEDASHPFWSPDGKNIAFFSKGKLRRLPAVGGAVTLICDAEQARGGAWSVDGTIVFAPKPYGPLMRVSATGGTPTPVTRMAGEDRGSHRLPYFMPDGKRLLFTQGEISTAGAWSVEIVLLDLASGKITPLLKEGSFGFYAPPGYLIFVRGTNLMAHPFDAIEGKLLGEAVVLAENVSVNGGRLAGAISISAQGTLVYRSTRSHSRLEWFDMDGRPQGTIGEPADFTFLELAPDGKQAAVIIRGKDGWHDGWICDTVRGARSKIVEKIADWGMFWSPDGAYLAYHAFGFRCHVRSTDGSMKDVDLTEGWPTSWSRDGKFLCINRQVASTGLDLMFIDTTGGEARPFRVTANSDWRGVFSPDGNWLAFISDESGRNEVVVAPLSGSGFAHQVAPSASDRYTTIWWLDDGTLIFQDASSAKLLAVTTKVNDGSIEFSAPVSTFGGLDLPSDVFTISRDGKRMLAAVPVAKGQAESLILVQNWPAAISSPR